MLARGEFDDHLLAVAAEECGNASHSECQEMEWSLHGNRDLWGTWGCDTSLNLASATEYHDVWGRKGRPRKCSEFGEYRIVRTYRRCIPFLSKSRSTHRRQRRTIACNILNRMTGFGMPESVAIRAREIS